MEKFWKNLMTEIEHTGELKPISRERIWKCLESNPFSASGTNLYRELEKKCLRKVENSWQDYFPIPTELMDKSKEIFRKIFDNLTIPQQELEEFRKLCMDVNDNNNFYVSYLFQAIQYFTWNLSSNKKVLTNEALTNGDLEFSELDTCYCSCMMWKNQDIGAEDSLRKKLELEFWEWYIKEAASLQGEDIYNYVICPQILLKSRTINNIEDFVKSISYELDYIKHEKTDNKKLLIFVREKGEGSECPRCGVFSNHVNANLTGREKLGKVNGWIIEFKLCTSIYYCDNLECSEKYFPTHIEVGHNEKVANFLSILQSEKGKVCEMFEI